MSKPAGKAVIFTDLDATLLDHDTYETGPAGAALARLAERGVPVCLCTSKTVAEVREWRRRLALDTPFAAENGGVVAVPQGYFEGRAGKADDALSLTTLGRDRAALCRLAYALRARHGYRFTGFSEMSVADIQAATGLSACDAEKAGIRHASEPLLWQDSETAEAAFTQQIEAAGAMTRRGGRFLHVLGHADKADALNWLVARYAQDGAILAVALGDSANDAAMLAAADIGYWVARADGSYQTPEAPGLRHAPGIGPAGWAAAIHAMIETGEL